MQRNIETGARCYFQVFVDIWVGRYTDDSREVYKTNKAKTFGYKNNAKSDFREHLVFFLPSPSKS